MKTVTILFGAAVLTLQLVNPMPVEDGTADDVDGNGSSNNRTVHFYVLMVPDSVVQELLKERSRQDEDGGGLLGSLGGDGDGVVSSTGAYVGQIISGVLGGDVRPIFAGSASFIGETDVQQGVSTILANVAPSVNNILKQWVNRAQAYLGISTTPKPGTLTNGTTNGTTTAQKPGTPGAIKVIAVRPEEIGLTAPPQRKPDEDEEENDVPKNIHVA